MSLFWQCVLLVAAAGGAGGFLAKVAPAGAAKDKLADAPTEAGWFVSLLAGAAAGAFTLLTSEAFKGVVVVGTAAKDAAVAAPSVGPSQLAAAFAAGLVGIKWLRGYQDSATLRQAVAEAASKSPDARTGVLAGSASPRQVLRAARES